MREKGNEDCWSLNDCREVGTAKPEIKIGSVPPREQGFHWVALRPFFNETFSEKHSVTTALPWLFLQGKHRNSFCWLAYEAVDRPFQSTFRRI